MSDFQSEAGPAAGPGAVEWRGVIAGLVGITVVARLDLYERLRLIRP